MLQLRGRIMIRKTFFIVFIFSAYVYLVSSDPNGNLIYKAKTMYTYWMKRYHKMDLKYQVNKWPDSKEERRHY